MSKLEIGMVLIAVAILPMTAMGKALTLANIFSITTMGIRIPYLETKIGPAKRVTRWRRDEEWRDYEVGSCQFTVIANDKAVNSLEVPLNGKCPIDLNTLLQTKDIPAHPTFGQIESAAHVTDTGKVYSDCLSNCGNASDPSLYLEWQGPHSNLFVEIMLQAKMVNADAIEAALKLTSIIAKDAHVQDFQTTDFLNCSKAYDYEARRLMRNVKVTSVQFGYDIVDPYLLNSCRSAR